MWVALYCLSVDNKSMLTSYWTRSWKWLRKTSARLWKVWKADPCNSLYHFAATPIRVHWKSRNRMESLFNEFDEHRRENVVTWSPESSPSLPSNLGMSRVIWWGAGANSDHDTPGHSIVSINLVSLMLHEKEVSVMTLNSNYQGWEPRVGWQLEKEILGYN